MWKIIAEPGRLPMTILGKRITCWLPKVTNTLRRYNNYCFSIGTLVARKRPIVTVYVHCVSCCIGNDVCLLFGMNCVLIAVPANLDKVALRQVFLWVIRFSPPNIIPPAPRIHRRRRRHRLRVALPERQTGEACEPSKEQCCFGNRGVLDRRVISLSSLNGYATASQYICVTVCRWNLFVRKTSQAKICFPPFWIR